MSLYTGIYNIKKIDEMWKEEDSELELYEIHLNSNYNTPIIQVWMTRKNAKELADECHIPIEGWEWIT